MPKTAKIRAADKAAARAADKAAARAADKTAARAADKTAARAAGKAAARAADKTDATAIGRKTLFPTVTARPADEDRRPQADSRAEAGAARGGNAPGSPEAAAIGVKQEAFKFEYGLSRKIRYFGKRRNFFDGLHRLSLFVSSVLGSSAFISIIADAPELGAVLAAVVAIVSSADNVIGFAERARNYAELRTRYYDIYCDFVIVDEASVNLKQFRERRLRVDRDAPPPRKILDVMSRNEEDIARGYRREETIYLGWWRRLVAQFIDLPPRAWRTVEQVEGAVTPPERTSSRSSAPPADPASAPPPA